MSELKLANQVTKKGCDNSSKTDSQLNKVSPKQIQREKRQKNIQRRNDNVKK